MNRLLVNPGTPQAWEIELKPGLNRIGREGENDFTVNHTSVSGSHCEITVSEAGVFLKDLGSTNGTFVNRAQVREVWLQSGQHVQLGPVDMTFESDKVPAAAAPVHASPPIPIPVPVPSHVPAAPAGLRITKGHAESSPPASPPPPPAAPTQSRFKQPSVVETNGKKPNFGLSLTGVILGAILGITLWHLIYRFTGKNFGIMALATGVLAGVAPQLMGHYRGKLMGFIAAAVALLAILTTQYFNTRHEMESDRKESVDSFYQEQLAYAKQATQAIPGGTEAEVRAFLVKEASIGEFKPKPEEMDPEEVAELQKNLPKYRDLVAGKITPEELFKRETDPEVDEFGAKLDRIFFIISVLGIFNIVNIFLGVGAAYLTAKGDGKN